MPENRLLVPGLYYCIKGEVMGRLCYNLGEVVGHQNVIRYLQDKLAKDTISDAILLTGSTGIGKTTIAKILACEIAYRYGSDSITMEEAKEKVIKEDVNTNEVLLFNMSNLRNDSEIQEVKANLSLGFSTTGRKVLLLDEAHGMTDEQQDSLLTSLEHLQTGVYVIMCTTEVGGLKDTLLGRFKTPLTLNSLSDVEIKTLIKRHIEDADLKFEMPVSTVISAISNFTGNEPRRALNLLSNFDDGSVVKTRDLEVFINVDECEQVVQLVKHLYGPVLPGMEYVGALRIDGTFTKSLTEVTKCALGASTNLLRRDSVLFLRDTMDTYGTENLLGFCMDVTASGRLTKSRLTGYFIKWNYESRTMLKAGAVPVKNVWDKTVQQDLGTMQSVMRDSSEAEKIVTPSQGVQRVKTMKELFAEGEAME